MLIQQVFLCTLSKTVVSECESVCVIGMDAGLREELNSIIEKLTHSGLPSLNQDLLKKLKRLCKYVVEMITIHVPCSGSPQSALIYIFNIP